MEDFVVKAQVCVALKLYVFLFYVGHRETYGLGLINRD